MTGKDDWRDGKIMSSKQLVEAACELLSVSDKKVVTYLDLDLFKAYSDILCGMFLFHKDIPGEVRQTLTKNCFLDMARSGVRCSSRLAVLLREQERLYLQKPPRKFILLSPLSLRYSEEIGRITTPKAVFTFSSSRPRSFPLPDGGSVLVKDTTPSGYAYAKVHVKARDPLGACEIAMNSLDLLRGLWNLYFNRQVGIRQTWVSDGRWTPVNSILPGPIHTLHDKDGKLAIDGIWWTTYVPHATQPRDSRRNLAKVRDFEKYARRKVSRSPFGDRVERLLVRYVRALDSHESSTTMINLWSTLEEVLAVKAGESARIIKRATFLDRDSTKGRLLLDFIREHRNMIAHAGASPGDIERYIYILKDYVERLILFVIFNSDKMKSYESLLKVLDSPTDELVIRSEIESLKRGLALREQVSA